MTESGNSDPDTPTKHGLLTKAHAAFGRVLINLAIRLRRPVSLGVRLLATNEKGEVLLVRQTYMPGLMLPGGAVEPGETCSEAALRETFEESGVRTRSPPALFHIYLNRSLAQRDHVVLYVAKDAYRVSTPAASLEILSAAFYPADNLPDDVTVATRARIEEVLQGAQPRDVW